MTTILTIVHVLVSFFLVAIVLLQQGKGADMGAAFGGGSSQTVFGADGPVSLLGKVTTAAAVIFMITSLTLAYQSSHNNASVMTKAPAAVKEVEKKAEPLAPQLIETKVPAPTEEQTAIEETAPQAETAAPEPAQAVETAAPAASPSAPAASQPQAEAEK